MGNLRSPEFKGKSRFESIFSENRSSYMLRGETSEDVRAVQRVLLKEDENALPDHGADGVYGNETEQAVFSLQKRHNFDGGIKEDGKVGVQTIALLDVVMVYDLIVKTAEQSKMIFGSNTSINPIFWKTITTNEHYQLRDPSGEKDFAAKAIYSLFTEYSTVECFMALNAFYLKAILDTLNWEAFSEYFKWNSETDPGLNIIKPVFASNDRLMYLLDELPYNAQTLKKGDWVYYKNDERYGKKHPNGAWSGENAIYVGTIGGNRLYRGHGVVGSKTEEDLFQVMVREFDAPDPASDPSVANATTHRKTPGTPFGVIGFKENFRLNLGKLSYIKRDPQCTPFTK